MFLRMDRLSSARVVLETHPNAYFFLHMAASRAPRGPLYVVVDKFPETLEMYKRKLDRSAPDLEILYLADASLDFPIRWGMRGGIRGFLRVQRTRVLPTIRTWFAVWSVSSLPGRWFWAPISIIRRGGPR